MSITPTRQRPKAPLSPLGRFYVACVIVAGGAALLHSVVALVRKTDTPDWAIFAALTLLSGSFSIKIPTVLARLSVSEMFTFTSVLLFGPAPGTLALALDGLATSLRRKHHLQRVLFNAAQCGVSIWIAGQVFFAIAGIAPLYRQPGALGPLIVPLLALTVAYFVLNTGLTVLAVAFETRTSAIRLWREHFLWLSVNYFAAGSVSLLLVVAMRQVSFGAIAVLLPLALVSYLTYRASLGRVEDAHQHVAQVNRLYLSTIETLAIAIDAKDEVTHGHIRRVQHYAVGLTRALGVNDATTLKAIEAAALLHDMGKLAVPEHILNKPGKLTPAEFEKMKLHVTVGAEILSTIEFPYPVVPIVRCHHENWDGTGYPDGVRGTDIPIGARILSVVDCFDALTSDRPYRPRMSEEAALRILHERRGTMYDPLVVDTFARVHAEIAPHETEPCPPQRALAEITRSALQSAGPFGPGGCDPEATAERDLGRDPGSRNGAMLALASLARVAAGAGPFADAAFLVALHLERIVPHTSCVLYVRDPATETLVARHVAGAGAAALQGLQIEVGQRLSGWVAVNRSAIVNSDAALDLGERVNATSPPLRSCLSVPLLAGETLIGVLTLYSTAAAGFTDDHSRMAQVIAPHIAQTVRATDHASRAAATRPPQSARAATEPSRPKLKIVAG